MRTFDLAPLYRSTVGFDRLFSMLDGFEAAPGYPPYNIERTGENDYRITVAVAGFGENDLSIEAKENTLTIKGDKQEKEEQNGEVLYQGIAARAFERVFQLADYVQVKAAALENGLAACRSRARDPGGEEAAPDPDRKRPGLEAARHRQQGGLIRRLIDCSGAPRFPGRFFIAAQVQILRFDFVCTGARGLGVAGDGGGFTASGCFCGCSTRRLGSGFGSAFGASGIRMMRGPPCASGAGLTLSTGAAAEASGRTRPATAQPVASACFSTPSLLSAGREISPARRSRSAPRPARSAPAE